MPPFNRTEDEYKAYIAYWTKQAVTCLTRARESSPENPQYLLAGLVEGFADKAGLRLKDLGTTSAELREIELLGYVPEAKKALAAARKPVCSYPASHTVMVRHYMDAAQVELSLIGTSEAELLLLEA
jgi:hypothetical protein